MTWNIDVVRARSVCETTEHHAEGIDTTATAVANAFATVQSAAAEATQTAAALREVAADPFLIRLAGMRRMVTTVTQTTAHVIDLYESADLEMAASTQTSMRGLQP
ncbi:DUF6507 family protein [Microbacterium sp. BWT-B31]|uniref:DUF6507 family protein n=1 Tax=Microbacterium sp. BWT-B31 TaxID=3232072 RepID=UPI0035275629